MTGLDELPPLARNVIRYRLHRRLTQTELAKRCKLSRKTIGNVERGDVTSLETILALAKGLETTAAKLLDDPGDHSTLTRYLDQLRRLFERASAQTREQLADLVRALTKRPEPAT